MDNFYFLECYDEDNGTVYKSKAKAMKTLLQKYLEDIDNLNITFDVVKNDLKTFIEEDYIENCGEVGKLKYVGDEE